MNTDELDKIQQEMGNMLMDLPTPIKNAICERLGKKLIQTMNGMPTDIIVGVAVAFSIHAVAIGATNDEAIDPITDHLATQVKAGAKGIIRHYDYLREQEDGNENTGDQGSSDVLSCDSDKATDDGA